MASSEAGYYATLGVTFRADDDAVSKRYKRLALKMHPDKNPSENAVDQFQRITTSYHIIADAEKRKNYLDLFRLRCYMSQTLPKPNSPLKPHYAFTVDKSKYARGSKSERLMVVDLFEQKLQSYKKDNLQKEFPLSALSGIQVQEDSTEATASTKSLGLVILFKETHPYYIRCRCKSQHDTLVAVIQRIVEATAVTDEAINVALDDAESPPSSLHKSKVLKRASGSVSWEPRFMVLGSTHLLLFRNVDLQQMVNIIPVSILRFTLDSRDGSFFQLATDFWKSSFRVVSPEVAAQWGSAIVKLQHAKGGRNSEIPRPSIAFSDADLTRMNQKGHQSRTGLAPIGEASGPSEAHRFPALPAPPLAPSEATLDGGWLMYSDDQGRKYYFNQFTHETTWEAPSAQQLESGDDAWVAEAPFATEAIQSSMSHSNVDLGDEESRAQINELRECEDTKTTPMAHAETKDQFLSAIQAVERSLHRVRLGVEAERSVEDFSDLMEELSGCYATMNTTSDELKRLSQLRTEQQQDFVQSRAAYLTGLQAHMLGDDGASDNMASRIFKKAAYVADTFSRHKQQAL